MFYQFLLKNIENVVCNGKKNIKVHNTIIFCTVYFYPSVIEENGCNKDITTFNNAVRELLVRSNTFS